MTCANTSFPAYIDTSPENPGRLPRTAHQVQVVNTPTCPESRASISFQADTHQICRTLLIANIDPGIRCRPFVGSFSDPEPPLAKWHRTDSTNRERCGSTTR